MSKKITGAFSPWLPTSKLSVACGAFFVLEDQIINVFAGININHITPFLFGYFYNTPNMGCRQVNNVNLLKIFRGQINNTENRAL